jgi:hypothetical protein
MREPIDPERADSGASTASRRQRAPDPLGKRALFWVPAQPEPGSSKRIPLGKEALYSDASGEVHGDLESLENPLTQQGRLVIECSRCGAVSRVGLLDFVIFSLPLGVWLPRGRFDRRLSCPSCHKRVWASVSLRTG